MCFVSCSIVCWIHFELRELEGKNGKNVDFGKPFDLTCMIHFFKHFIMIFECRIDAFTQICFENPKISNGQMKEQV